MSTFFLADPHFGHHNIIEYCRRPFSSVQEMDQVLLDNWNSRIRPHDTAYILGDLALCKFQEFAPIAAKLNGRKFLIRGNHDKYSIGQYERLGFTVFEELKIKLCGRQVRLSHYPYAHSWWRRPFAYKSELRFMDKRPPRIEREILLHGHTHGAYQVGPSGIHVGVDAWHFYPVSLGEIESLLPGGDK